MKQISVAISLQMLGYALSNVRRVAISLDIDIENISRLDSSVLCRVESCLQVKLLC